MAIPDWLWPKEHPGSQDSLQIARDEPVQTRVQTATIAEKLELLANDTRLEIICSLHSCPAPVSYTRLQDRTSIEDKGRFNYHLRKLDELISKQGGQYTLNKQGEKLAKKFLSDETTLFSE